MRQLFNARCLGGSSGDHGRQGPDHIVQETRLVDREIVFVNIRLPRTVFIRPVYARKKQFLSVGGPIHCRSRHRKGHDLVFFRLEVAHDQHMRAVLTFSRR